MATVTPPGSHSEQTTWRGPEYAPDIPTQQVDEAKARVDKAQAELTGFMREHGGLDGNLNFQLRARTPGELDSLKSQLERLRLNYDACVRKFQAALKAHAEAKFEHLRGTL